MCIRDRACTEAYASVASILVRNKNITFPNEELIGGVLEGRDLPDNISAKEVKYYRNATDALAAEMCIRDRPV